MTGGDDIGDASFVVVGGIALRVTGRGQDSGGEQEGDARNGRLFHCHGALPAQVQGLFAARRS